MNSRSKMTDTPVRQWRKGISIGQCLGVFKRMLLQLHLKLALKEAPIDYYERLFTPTVTLWCMIFQRLNPDHTLQAAVYDLHSGGADRLASRKEAPPSKRVRSLATTAFSKARARLPLSLLSAVLDAQARDVWSEFTDGLWHGLRVLLLDGSQIALRPYPDITRRFAPSSNQNGTLYWVLMRVVATFCLHTGIVVATAADSTRVSEQTLARRQLLKEGAGCLYLGDRNFGVFQMVQSVLQAKAHCLFRLSEARARRIAKGSATLRRPGDYALSWSPSKDDLKVEGCQKEPINGRLIVAKCVRAGFRSRWLYLFTTLQSPAIYPASKVVELYGARWNVEINLRYLKTEMDLHQLECKRKDMPEKEWLSGVLAYNLVRVVMASAATAKGIPSSRLSFSATRRFLLQWLWKATPNTKLANLWRNLLKCVARARQPTRKNTRPPEPRAKRHKRETFPPLKGPRSVAREQLRVNNMKS